MNSFVVLYSYFFFVIGEQYWQYICFQAYTSQIVVMAMLALAIGADAISSQPRREAIIDGLFDLPSEFWFSSILS